MLVDLWPGFAEELRLALEAGHPELAVQVTWLRVWERCPRQDDYWYATPPATGPGGGSWPWPA